tara:strand:- start:2670 stop:2816 length:147 start_codon:yes stop_codon:yes gene_type:complete
VALEYIFFHNDENETDDPKYVSLKKKGAHEIEELDKEMDPGISDDAPR